MRQDRTVFDREYTRLNSEQKQAVDTIEGPVMVVAGPGTGKTQILTLRIAQILLKTQLDPGSILALTYTQAAASNMRERLLRIIGSDAHAVNIFTFHAFCTHVIELNPDDFWEVLGRKLADDMHRIKILESVVDTQGFTRIKPYGKPHYYVGDALRAISDLKREGVDPSELASIVATQRETFIKIPDKESTRVVGSLKGVYQDQLRDIEKNEELAKLYALYQAQLQEQDLYDYDDLIMYLLAKLRSDADFRLRQMERNQYILVDEHQDSNNAQNKILQLLTSYESNPNIFVVGDEKQAIFRFQGASIENFRRFTSTYPGAVLIRLRQNYRSTQTILDSAIHLLGADDQQLVANISADPRPITVIDTPTPDAELAVLVSRIQSDLGAGVSPDQIVVLTRTREKLRDAARALTDAQIPVYLDLDVDVFRSDTIKRLLIILRAVVYFAQPEHIFPLLHLDFVELDPLSLYKLTQAVSRKRMGLEDILADPEKLRAMDVREADKMHKLFNQIGRWHTLSHQSSLQSLLHTIVRESGLLRYILRDSNPILATAPLRELYDNLQSVDQEDNWTLTDLFTYITKLEEHNLTLRASVKTQSKDKVQLMTVHGAKGLEFDHVYIPFAQDTVWGGRKRPRLFHLPDEVYSASSDTDMDDDKRLFFVALTRARHVVCISYSHTKKDGTPSLPSPYIDDILPHLRSSEHSSQDVTSATLQTDRAQKPQDEFSEFVQASFAEYGLSVSALNNYLQCPWKYFYVNLVRVPSGKDKILMFGNAVHNALTYFFRHFKQTGERSRDYLLEAFEQSAKQEMFTTAEINDAIVRGKQILRSYYDTYVDRFTRNVQVKLRIPSVLIPSEDSSSTIKLTGEIDLVEYLDHSLTSVDVIDFKTGRAKSRGEIQGQTKGADGNYYRQLVFYKLLLQHFRPSWTVREGVLDFVQPDSKGVMHRESFQISDSEVRELTATIHESVRDILGLNFWNRECKDGKCEWCALRRSLDHRLFEGGLF